MAEDEPTRSGPTLRISKLALTNFRSFRARTVLPFADVHAAPDPIVTLHGDNGTGKSSALAALDAFFLALMLCLEQGDENGELLVPWDASFGVLGRTLVIAYRDRPVGADGPTDLEVDFQDPRLGTIRVRLTPAGRKVRIRAEHRLAETAAATGADGADGFVPFRREERDQLLTWLQTPLGPASRPLAILSERRQPMWLTGANQGSLLHPSLLEQLFALRTDLDPLARDRWRAFGETLQQFPQFRGKVIEIQRTERDLPPQLTVEEPRRTVLPLEALSSGEQQIIIMYAAVVFANAPIVVIEEPEVSLDDKNQRTFRSLLAELVKSGQVDQIILESHVAAFDGERVLRFHRSSTGSTVVERGPSAGTVELETRDKAKERGARQSWITRDGYTQLPDTMREDLGVGNGAPVWFFKEAGRWGAWPAAELDQLFGFPGEGTEK